MTDKICYFGKVHELKSDTGLANRYLLVDDTYLRLIGGNLTNVNSKIKPIEATDACCMM